MELYKLKNNKLQEVSRKNFDLEKDINSEREDEGVYFNLPKKIKAFGTSQ